MLANHLEEEWSVSTRCLSSAAPTATGNTERRGGCRLSGSYPPELLPLFAKFMMALAPHVQWLARRLVNQSLGCLFAVKRRRGHHIPPPPLFWGSFA